MSLNAVLVDRGRIHNKAATGTRVEGTMVYAATQSAWFRARLTMTSTPGVDEPVTAARQVAPTPQMLCGVRDSDGQEIVINVSDRIEIDSAELGVALWDVSGDPEPLRKKRRVIGWQVPLRRVEVPATAQVRR